MTALASCSTSLVRQSKTVEQFRKRVFIEFVSFNNKVHESVVHKYSTSTVIDIKLYKRRKRWTKSTQKNRTFSNINTQRALKKIDIKF